MTTRAMILAAASPLLALAIVAPAWTVLADDQPGGVQAQMGDDPTEPGADGVDGAEGDASDEGDDASSSADNQPACYAEKSLVDRDAPSRFMMVLLAGESKPVKVRPLLIKGADGVPYPDADERLFRVSNSVEAEWPGTRRVRRYTFWAWADAFTKYRKPQFAQAKLVFQRLGKAEKIDALVSELNIQLLPQTWENIWQRMVEGPPSAPVSVDERIMRVQEFAVDFDEQIQNKEANDEYFSPEERNAFNQFYYRQYAIALDRNPRDPSVYRELAEYFRLRNKVDPMLTVYLDAIRNEVPEDVRREFHLKIGTALVERLRLYEAAIPHLEQAGEVYADARLLLVQCYEALERYDDARIAALELVAAIDALGDSSTDESGDEIPEDGAAEQELLFLQDEDTVRNRALLYKARANITSMFGDQPGDTPFKSASQTLDQIPYDGSIERDEADYLLASMFSYRNLERNEFRRSDADLAMGIIAGEEFKFTTNTGRQVTIPGNARFAKLLTAGRVANPDLSKIAYDPLGCKALCVWAQSRGSQTLGKALPLELDAVLNYAAELDPLSSEPALVRGVLLESISLWTDALKSYEAGLSIQPDEPRLNYQIGMLKLATGDVAAAESRFRTVLRSAPRFYAAMNQLGRIELARSEDLTTRYARLLRSGTIESEENAVRDQLRQIGEDIVGALQQARAFFSSSLNLNPEQNSIRAVLASLYTQVAMRNASANRAQAISYLESARDLASQVISAVREYGSEDVKAQRTSKGRLQQTEVASAPPMHAYTVKAFACYELWRLTNRSELRIEALQTLVELELVGNNIDYYPNSEALSAFSQSNDMTRAMDTLARMRANERQRMKRDSFVGADRAARGADSLTNNWGIFGNLKPDTSFYEGTRIADGMLTLEIKKQESRDIISRVSRVERFSQLASFQATIEKLGFGGFERGIHFTAQEVAQDNKGAKERWSILIGFTEFNEPFYDVRIIDEDSTGGFTERSVARKVLDPASIGALLDPEAPITLMLERRVPQRNGSEVFYSMRINNGRLIPIDLSVVSNGERADIDDPARITSTTRVGEGRGSNAMEVESYQMLVGFWMLAPVGSSASMSVTECEWVLDSELAQRDED